MPRCLRSRSPCANDPRSPSRKLPCEMRRSYNRQLPFLTLVFIQPPTVQFYSFIFIFLLFPFSCIILSQPTASHRIPSPFLLFFLSFFLYSALSCTSLQSALPGQSGRCVIGILQRLSFLLGGIWSGRSSSGFDSIEI